MYRYSFAAITLMASSFSGAVEVVDSKPIGSSGYRDSTPPPMVGSPAVRSGAAQGAQQVNTAELFYQLQTMQQELMELRGLVEQQAHDIKKLKQQRLDDYIDLDRRISDLRKGGVKAASSAESASSVVTRTPSSTGGAADELGQYRTAIDLVLKKRNYDEGIKALTQYLSDYPEGQYVANSQYWLGQLYLQRNELATSLEWFERMVKGNPDHRKAPEAKFKLGKVQHLMGNKAEAKRHLDDVSGSKTSAATLAKEYLKKHF